MTAQIAFANVLLTLLYILPGFALAKHKKASVHHLSTLSAILIYACAPCMVIDTFLHVSFTKALFLNMAVFFVLSFAIQAAFILGIYLLYRKKFSDSRYRMLSMASVMGNVGFFGLPIVNALLPEFPEAGLYACMYLVSMNIIVFTVGVYCLTLKKETMNLKSAILNPSVVGVLIAIPLFITGAGTYLPSLVTDALSAMSKMTTPLCMMILGIRLSMVPFKKLFGRPFVYVICLCKLLLYPLFCLAVVYFLPLEESFRSALIILSAAPCASIILNMAEMYKSETENAANCVLLSTLVCFLTIPLITLLI